jgi:virginiamycin B lyase
MRPTWFSGAGDILWVSNVPDGTVSRLDPATGAVTATVKVGTQPVDGTLAPDGLIWIPNLGDRTITRIDPATAQVVGTMRVGPKPFVLSVAFGDVWSPAWGGQRVWRIQSGSE